MAALNKKQVRIVLAGAVLFVAMGLYPPWIETAHANAAERENPAGYALFMLPPEAEEGIVFGVRLDTSRLLLQWLVLSVATGALVLAGGKSED